MYGHVLYYSMCIFNAQFLGCQRNFICWNLHHPHHGKPHSTFCLQRLLSAAGHQALRCSMVQDQSPHLDLPDKDEFIWLTINVTTPQTHIQITIWTVLQNPWECCSNLTLQVLHRRESKALMKSCVVIWSPVSKVYKWKQTYWFHPHPPTTSVQRKNICSFVGMDYIVVVYRSNWW